MSNLLKTYDGQNAQSTLNLLYNKIESAQTSVASSLFGWYIKEFAKKLHESALYEVSRKATPA